MSGRHFLILIAVGAAMGQMHGPRPQFDVVSVKPNTGLERAVQVGFPSPGTFHASNVWLRFLIENAWNVRDYQVLGGSPWTSSARFDIDAKTDPHVPREQMRLMVQNLLQERFPIGSTPRIAKIAGLSLGRIEGWVEIAGVEGELRCRGFGRAS